MPGQDGPGLIQMREVDVCVKKIHVPIIPDIVLKGICVYGGRKG